MASKIVLAARIKSAAVQTLKKELTFSRLVKLLPAMAQMKKNGEPWTGMPLAVSEKDRASRELIGEAILLYRALLKAVAQPEAERITRAVITESAIAQLRTLIPKISRAEILAMTPAQRRERFCGIVARFPNADWELTHESETQFDISITRCRLVELIRACGHPELSDAFCAGDALYFERHQPDIHFARQGKIAAGDNACGFKFGLTGN